MLTAELVVRLRLFGKCACRNAGAARLQLVRLNVAPRDGLDSVTRRDHAGDGLPPRVRVIAASSSSPQKHALVGGRGLVASELATRRFSGPPAVTWR